MRKSLVLVLLLLSAAQYSQAQVDNYALRFSGKGSVTCGELVDMEQQKSYTLQFWMNPDVWTDGATVFSSGDSFSASLGTEGSIIFKVGDTSLSATATQQLSAGKWTQVTLVCNDGTAQVLPTTSSVAKATCRLSHLRTLLLSSARNSTAVSTRCVSGKRHSPTSLTISAIPPSTSLIPIGIIW